jgi:hypothetical protein
MSDFRSKLTPANELSVSYRKSDKHLKSDLKHIKPF